MMLPFKEQVHYLKHPNKNGLLKKKKKKKG